MSPGGKRTTFTTEATLERLGQRASCVVMGTREHREGEQSRVRRLSVVSEPEELTDGSYLVRFESEAVWMRRVGGLWLLMDRPERP